MKKLYKVRNTATVRVGDVRGRPGDVIELDVDDGHRLADLLDEIGPAPVEKLSAGAEFSSEVGAQVAAAVGVDVSAQATEEISTPRARAARFRKTFEGEG